MARPGMVRRLLFWSVTGSLIGLALLLALVQLALPWWASSPERVAGLLSSRLGTAIEIGATRPYWSPSGPVIELLNVRLGDPDGPTLGHIERAAWAIDITGLVRRSRALSEFRVHGLDLTLARGEDGVWQVLGLPELLRGEGQPLTQSLHALPALALRDSRLVVRESPQRPERIFMLRELRRSEAGVHTRWLGRVAPQGTQQGDDPGELMLVLELGGETGDRLFVSGDELDLVAWLGALGPLAAQPQQGRFDLDAWIGLDATGVHDVQLELRQGRSTWRVDEPGVEPEAATSTLALAELSLGLRWQRSGDERRLLVEDLLLDGASIGRLQGWERPDGIDLQTSDLDLAAVTQLLQLAVGLPPPLREWLRQARPRGQLRRLDLSLEPRGRPRQLSARLDRLAFAPALTLPGIHGLSLDVLADRDGLALWPDADEFLLDYPGVFSAPLRLHSPSGALVAWSEVEPEPVVDHEVDSEADSTVEFERGIATERNDGIDGDTAGERETKLETAGSGWWLAFDQLTLVGEDVLVALAGGVRWRPGEPLHLDLGAQVRDSGVMAALPFLPINRIPNTANWLNRSLLGGRIVEGDFWVRGGADDYPFADDSGRLEAVAEIADASLRYHAQWPELTQIEAELRFVNQGMRIQGKGLRIAGITVADASAEVADFKQPSMKIQAQASPSGERLLNLVRVSPLQDAFGRHIQSMAVEGSPRVELELTLPMRPGQGLIAIDGRLHFAGERFTDSRWNLDFSDLDGVLHFSRTGMNTQALGLRLAGEAARLNLRVGSDTEQPSAALEGALQGWLSADAMFGGIQVLAPLLRRSRGRANWQVGLQVPNEAAGGSGRIQVQSDLRGLILDLPAPLTKSADSRLPLQLDVATDATTQPLRLRLGQILRMHAQLPSAQHPFAGSVALGGATPERLPERGLIVTGQVPALDLSGWLALDERDASDRGATAIWPQVMLRAGELGVLGRRFQDVDLQVLPGPDQVEVRLRGPQIEGQVQWPLAQNGDPVRGRFERLHVPSGDQQALGDTLAPGAMPALDFEAETLHVGDSRLGRVRLQGRPEGGVYHIDAFTARSPAFELDASGDWQRLAEGDRSRLDVELRADDAGIMLESFGFAGLIEGGQTLATIQGHWAGTPAAFALERIDGRLDLEIGAGRIVDVDPGVGRLFGLLNLREIPRRLMLDFRDFFSQGLRFNSIVGSFRLDVGDAWTDDLVLKSASADILVTGRTGLAGRDYDQTIEVTPRLSGTLPVVGAIAGGPAGAAAGLVMQGLLRIDQASRTVYRITGSWEEPDIIKQEAETEPSRRRSGRQRN